MFWKPVFQQGYTPKILLLAHYIISQIGKDYYYSYKYTPCPPSFSRSSQWWVWDKKRKHHMQSLSIHMWVLPAKLPSLKWNKPSCQQQSVGLHGGRFHVFCAGISHSSAVGKELKLLLTAMSCNSSFCSQWPETLKSLEMPKITLPACLLTSGSTCTAIPPGTHTAKHHTALWSKKHPKCLHTEGKKKRAEQKDEGMEGWRSRVCTGARRRQHNRWKGWKEGLPYAKTRKDKRSGSLHCSILPLLDCAGSFTWQRPCR